jgi:hypothetical protein
MPLKTRVGVLAVLVALSACGAPDSPTAAAASHAPWDGSPVQTDSLTYTLRRNASEYRTFVRATYRNATGSPVYFARCTGQDPLPMFFIRRTGPDSTRSFFIDWGWACVGRVPTGIHAPGDSVTVIAPFGSVDQPFMQPPLRPEELVGTFRIQPKLCNKPTADSDHCEASPWESRISNAFTVRY